MTTLLTASQASCIYIFFFIGKNCNADVLSGCKHLFLLFIYKKYKVEVKTTNILIVGK